MLHSTYRFHGYNALRYSYKGSRTFRSDFFSLKYNENKRRHKPRVAIVVSKKVLKSAVGRNRIRRRMYEQIRHEIALLKPNLDIICIVHSAELRTLDAKVLHQLVVDSFTQSGLYKTREKNGTL